VTHAEIEEAFHLVNKNLTPGIVDHQQILLYIEENFATYLTYKTFVDLKLGL
jgi:hypothetical protein